MIDLPRPTAFVLSGGASLGAVQVGMLHALHEAGVGPDLVVGTSVGALNGAVVAYDPERAHERLAEIWRNVRRHDVFPGGLASQARTLLRTRTHLFSSARLARLVETSLPIGRFDELRVRFAAVATDAQTGHAVPLTQGRVLTAILASAAIPGVFPAVSIDGRTYLDGGIASNVPLPEAVRLGAASIVALDPGFPCHRAAAPRSITEMLLFAGAALLREHALCALPAAASRVPVVYLPAPCPQSTSPFDFSQTAQLMSVGRELSAQFLADLRVGGPGLYGSPHVHEEGAA